MKKSIIYFIIIVLIIFLAYIIYKYKESIIESFDAGKLIPIDVNKYVQTNDRFTKDKCCIEKEIYDCGTYGKTGVCDYYKSNSKSCICENTY